MELTGAQSLIKSLEQVGVEVLFGLPGGAILPVYDPLIESSMRHILVRHEQGAGHAAEGYAHVTGRPGVAMVTSGPGATNIVTPLADAFMDSVPLVVISGQVATSAIGTDAFQEVDFTGITQGVTKHNWLVTDPDEIPRIIREAFYVATTGRPGPVVVDFPKDVANAKTEWSWSDEVDLPGYRPPAQPDMAAVKKALELIYQAERPVVYVGGGVIKANATEELTEFIEMTDFPLVTTLMARGAFPDTDPRHLGMPGMHGSYAAVTAIQKSDLLISFGARFDDRVTGKVSAFAPKAKVIHVDIDPAEIGKVRRPDVPVIADCALAIRAMVDEMKRVSASKKSVFDSRTKKAQLAWREQVTEWKTLFPFAYDGKGESNYAGPIKPQQVVEELSAASDEDTILVTGVGQHQMWASQLWSFSKPRSWVSSGGLGTMGFAVPAAMGAKVGQPAKTVWAVDGDGCFQMTAQELITCSQEQIPVKIAILNNAYLGMVRQWQQMFYEERYSEVYLSADLPDYVKWAESMGCVGFRVDDPGEVSSVIEKANSIHDKPVVVDFRTDSMEKVFPMVPAGASNDDILVHPSLRERLAKEV
ncbi:MAG: acetolactate synthase large subunit [Firmicutes bacterium]|jgi:acetolactate synthase-1/2/3 large subunit|nr:acetolactate synthase large subunit [Bacillota bacterium]